MGRFFTSIQILNEEKLNKDAFLKKYCEKISYQIHKSDTCDRNNTSFIWRFNY